MAEELEGLELDRQYTPSSWSRRLPAQVIVDRHVEVLSVGCRGEMAKCVSFISPSSISTCPNQLISEPSDVMNSPMLRNTRMWNCQQKHFNIQYIAILATAHAQKALTCELAVCYDQESKQTLDIYYPKQSETSKDGGPSVAPAGPTILLYIHGGYWCALGTEHSGFFAENCSAEGILLVAIGYDLAPKVTMTTIVNQCRMACAYVYKRFPGCRLFVGGHSAGGHLSACMLYTNWCEYGIETQPLSGAILLSGIYDLRLILRCHVNGPLNLTDEEVLSCSPQMNLERIKASLLGSFPCFMAVGGDESDEFQRQGEEFHQGLLSVGVASTNSTLPEHDHFILTENLVEGDHSFSRDVIAFILSNVNALRQ